MRYDAGMREPSLGEILLADVESTPIFPMNLDERPLCFYFIWNAPDYYCREFTGMSRRAYRRAIGFSSKKTARTRTPAKKSARRRV